MCVKNAKSLLTLVAATDLSGRLGNKPAINRHFFPIFLPHDDE